MVVNERPLKRMNKRVTADLNDFLTFPDSANDFSGPFRSNIRSFLSKIARLPSSSPLFSNLLLWQISFRIGELIDGQDSTSEIVTLDIVEEEVARSRSVYCDQCRVIGWSHHPVCRRRYHFIIRRNNRSIDGHHKSCTSCGCLLQVSDSRCESCDSVLTADDVQDWVQRQLEDTTHLLHGVVHANGYGHLLRVNGREGGSELLSGCDIMNFWDRLCRSLGVRKISVMDVSKKYGMEYRLLHAVTNGHNWYGNWAYEFGTGSFALTHEDYRKAVDYLSGIPLSLFFQARKPRTRLQDVITFYQSLSESPLTTIGELFCFLMRLIHIATKQSYVVEQHGSPCSWVLCTWTSDDIERVQQSMIKVLQVADQRCWVPWRALKGAACRLASPELLDYCLKLLGGKELDHEMVVLSRCDPKSDAIEYRIGSRSEMGSVSCTVVSNSPNKDYILRHLKFLYDDLLNPHTMLNYRPKETREHAVCSAVKLLDCKQFVKDYDSSRTAFRNPFAVSISCQVKLIGQTVDYTAPPPEFISLPLNATIADLKIEATKAFQDVYLLFRRFQVEELQGYEQVKESSQLKLLIGPSGSVRVKGKLLAVNDLEHFRMERGTEIWTVRCDCGAKDDDGERMLACDACGIWQHTRCIKIPDSAPAPDTYSCRRCESVKRSVKYTKTSVKRNCGTKRSAFLSRTNSKCKDEVITSLNSATSRSGSHSGFKKGIFAVDTCSSQLTSSSISRTDGNGKIFEVGQTCFINMESPSQSGLSSDCKEKILDVNEASSVKKRPHTNFETDSKCAFETQAVDTCSSEMESSNPSGITSECRNESSAVVDTCSSNVGFARHSENCWKCKEEPATVLGACRIINGMKVPLVSAE